jgi:hypothetical protein
MPKTNSTSPKDGNPNSDQVTIEAMRRNRLAELIGRLLARVILRQRTKCLEVPADDEELP